MNNFLLLILLLLIVLIIILIILIINNKNNSSKFGNELQKFIYNLTNSPVTVYSIINQNKEYTSIDNTSNTQYYTTLRLYSSESTNYYYYYYGGGWGAISSDPTYPTVLTLNATGGWQTKNNANIGRYIRIFNNNNPTNYSITPLLIYCVNSGTFIDSGDAASVGFWKYISPPSSDGRTLSGPVIKSIGNSREVLGTYQYSQASLYSYTFNIGTWYNSNLSNTTSRVCITKSIPANGGRIQKDDDYYSYGLLGLYNNYVNNIKISVPRYELINDFTKDDKISSTQLFRLNLNISSSGTGSGTVTSSQTGLDASTSSGNYGLLVSGTIITLTATPDSVSSTFAGWSGDASGNNSPLTITMDSDKTVMATFNKKQYTLTINTNGSTGNGSVTTVPAPTNGLFDFGTVVTLTANPTGGSTFAGWSGNVTPGTVTSTGTITMYTSNSVTATFNAPPVPIKYTLTVSANGTGTGTVTSSPGSIYARKNLLPSSGIFDSGTVVTLTATPTGGDDYFMGWSSNVTPGTVTSTGTITMDNTKSVTATFDIKYTLNLKVGGKGTGTITPTRIDPNAPPTPGAYKLYDPGKSVRLTAYPSGTNIFAGWYDGDVLLSRDNPYTIKMNNTITVTGKMDKYVTPPPAPIIQYTLFLYGGVGRGTGTATVKDSNGNTLQPDDLGDYGPFNTGTDLVLTATPNVGSDFVAWGLDNGNEILSTNNPYTVKMDSNKTIGPIFNKKQYRLTGSTNGSGTGTVTVNIGYTTLTSTSAGDYGLFDFGTIFTITATPTGTSIFAGWTGDVVSTTSQTTYIEMDDDNNKVFTATFNLPAQVQYSLTVNKDGTGDGTITTSPANGPFDSGTLVTLTATPTGTSIFAGWSGDVSSTLENSVRITMGTSKTVTAKFLSNPSWPVPYAQYNCPTILPPDTY